VVHPDIHHKEDHLMNNDEVQVILAKLIGTSYTEAVKAQIRELTGRARVVGPTDISTMDYDESRIHVVAGGNGVISGFRFG
jgi:hypothetical protein